jgi:hypothetical protein
MKLFSDIPDYADTSLPLQTSKASQEWSGTGVSPVTGGTERTGETPVPLLLPRQGRQHDTVRRILWIVNHKTLMSGEVPLLRSLGFEVFVPKILPAHDRNLRSAGVTYDYDAALDHAAFFSLLMGSIRKNGRIGNRVLP